MLASFAIHVLAIGWMVWLARPIFVHTALSAAGNGGRSQKITYLAPAELPRLQIPAKRITLVSPSPKLSLPRDPQRDHPPVTRVLNDSQPAKASAELAGTRWGTLIEGSVFDVRPALPEFYPDPPIYRLNLPPGVAGDVIVEVTIDARGNVIDTRLLQGIGYGIEDRVLATVQNWHFRPAMQDGRAIASKQDLHFHLPS